MSKTRTILKNSGALAVSAVLGKFFYFLLFIAIGRYLGPDDLGKFSFAISFTALFAVINDLGLNTLAVKEVAGDLKSGGRYLSNLVALRFFLALVSFGLIIGTAEILGYPPEIMRILIVMGLATLFISASNGMRWYFQASQKLEFESLIGIIQSFAYLVFGFLALKLNYGVLGVVSSQALVGLVTTLIAFWVITTKFVPFKPQMDWSFWKTLLKSAVPFALMLVCTTIYLNADTVILSFFKGDKIVGFYNAANKLVQGGKMIPGIVIPGIFPVMVQYSKGLKEEFDNLLEKSLVFMFFMAFPIAIFTSLMGGKIILFFYGKQFVPASGALQILIWGMLFMYLSIVLGFGLISFGRQKLNTVITAIGLLVSIIVNLLLISRFAHIGTSIAITITEFVVLILGACMVKRLLKFRFSRIIKPTSKIAFASLSMGVVIHLLKDLPFLLLVLLGGVVYFLTLFTLCGGLYNYDLHRIKNIISAKLQMSVGLGKGVNQ